VAAVSAFITSLRYDLRDYSDHEFPDPELVEYLNRAVIQLDSALLSINSDWLLQTHAERLAEGANYIAQPTQNIGVRSAWISSVLGTYESSDATFAATGNTITVVSGNFTDDGFAANQTLGVDGSTSNDTEDIGLLTASSVTDTVITVNEDVIVDENPATVYIFTVGDNTISQISSAELLEKRKFLNSDGQPRYWAYQGTNLIFDYIADQDYGVVFHFNQKSDTLTTSSTMPYNDEFNEELREAVVLIAQNELADVTMLLYDTFRAAATTKAIRRNFVPKRYRIDF